MNQKITNLSPVTKDDLKRILRNYPTKDDLSKALSNHPNRIELRMELKYMREYMQIDIDEKARKYRDEILTRMDHIVGELAQIREDRVFEKHEKTEMKEQFHNHDARIKKLENGK